MTKRVKGYDGNGRSRGARIQTPGARTDEPMPLNYKDRMDLIVRGLRLGESSDIKREAAAFIQEQAAMIVRLEAELQSVYA